MPPETCPNCGADVPPKARACPECGADEKTGWSETAYARNLGIPEEEDEFDYGEFVKDEFGQERIKPRDIKWIWWVTAIILVLLLLTLYLD